MKSYPMFAIGPDFKESLFSLARTQLIFVMEAHVKPHYTGQRRDL